MKLKTIVCCRIRETNYDADVFASEPSVETEHVSSFTCGKSFEADFDENNEKSNVDALENLADGFEMHPIFVNPDSTTEQSNAKKQCV